MRAASVLSLILPWVFGIGALISAGEACTPFGSGDAPDEAGIVDGAFDVFTTDGGADADSGCRPGCDTACVNGTCPPFEVMTGFHNDGGSPELNRPFALEVDDTGIYIGDSHDGESGAIWFCNAVPATGKICPVKSALRRPNLRAMTLGQATVLYASDIGPSQPPPLGVGVLTRDCLPRSETEVGKAFTDLAGDGNNVAGISGADKLSGCNLSSALDCMDSNASATSLDARSGSFGCVTGKMNGAAGVFCFALPLANNVVKIVDDSAASLSRMLLIPGRGYWSAGDDIHSIEIVGGKAVNGANIEVITGTGNGPFGADANRVYYALNRALFVVARNSGKTPELLATAKGNIAAVTVFGEYVYFSYGEGASSGVARVPK